MLIFHDECELIEDDPYDFFTAKTEVERRLSGLQGSPRSYRQPISAGSRDLEEHESIM